jgi:hypothetical protein
VLRSALHCVLRSTALRAPGIGTLEPLAAILVSHATPVASRSQ